MKSQVLALVLSMVCISGCANHKPAPVPSPPQRTAAQQESARQVGGVIQQLAQRADARGIVAQSTESGTLVRAANSNAAYLGSPSDPVSADDARAVDALLKAMARQEEAYRSERAEWEQRIDAMSRDRDRAVAEVSILGGAVARLKAWLFWGAVLLGAACLLCPGLLWFLVRFVGGRAKAHVVSMVEGIEEFRRENKDIAPRLEGYLSRKMDNSTKLLVKQVKMERGM